jgi:hypothetical protein
MYAEYCDRVHVVSGPAGLERVAHLVAQEATGR